MLASWSQVRRDDVSASNGRPGQQNRRETPIPASGSKDRGHQEAESREIQKESAEAGQPPSANSSSSAITPQERAAVQIYLLAYGNTTTTYGVSASLSRQGATGNEARPCHASGPDRRGCTAADRTGPPLDDHRPTRERLQDKTAKAWAQKSKSLESQNKTMEGTLAPGLWNAPGLHAFSTWVVF